MNDAPAILFREDQRFRSTWLLLLAGGSALFALLGGLALLVGQVLLGHSLGNRPLPDWAAALVGGTELMIGLGLIWLFWKAVLQVEVTTEGLFIRFFPFQRKVRQIDLSGVTGIAAVRYRPLRDYGGWGLRWGWRSRCYNVSGNEGVRIDYDNNYHLLIGSQRAAELEAALHAIWGAETGETEP